jgi:hypothetical protein
LDSDYDSERDSDVDMSMEDDVNAPDGVDLDGNVDFRRHSEDEEDEEEEDAKEEDEKKKVVVDENEEESEHEENGKQPRTIGQGEIVNSSADDVDSMVDNQPTVLPEQSKEMRKHNLRPQPPAPARWP